MARFFKVIGTASQISIFGLAICTLMYLFCMFVKFDILYLITATASLIFMALFIIEFATYIFCCNQKHIVSKRPRALWYKISAPVCIVICIAYFIMFTSFSESLDYGTSDYMNWLLPGFMPLFSCAAMKISRFFLGYV